MEHACIQEWMCYVILHFLDWLSRAITIKVWPLIVIVEGSPVGGSLDSRVAKFTYSHFRISSTVFWSSGGIPSVTMNEDEQGDPWLTPKEFADELLQEHAPPVLMLLWKLLLGAWQSWHTYSCELKIILCVTGWHTCFTLNMSLLYFPLSDLTLSNNFDSLCFNSDTVK